MDHFWLKTPLARMTHSQWETLCDGCGRCCLQKLKNPSTGKVYYTWVACYLLDLQTCRCSDYAMRHVLVADCIELGPTNIASLYWMPGTCAYRLVAQGKDLPDCTPWSAATPARCMRPASPFVIRRYRKCWSTPMTSKIISLDNGFRFGPFISHQVRWQAANQIVSCPGSSF